MECIYLVKYKSIIFRINNILCVLDFCLKSLPEIIIIVYIHNKI